MTTETTPLSPDDSWTDCPDGAVETLVGRLQRRRRRERMRRVAVGVSCVCVVLIAGVYALGYMIPSAPGSATMTCADVHRLADDYLARRLDEATTDRVDVHLAECRVCRQFLDARRNAFEALPVTPVQAVRATGARRLLSDPVLARIDEPAAEQAFITPPSVRRGDPASSFGSAVGGRRHSARPGS